MKGNKYIPWLVAILFFLRLGPYFVWEYESFYFSYGLTLAISLLFFLHAKKLNKDDKLLYFTYFLAAIAYGVANHNAMVGAFVILLGIIAFSEEDFNRKVFSSFISLFSILVGLGVVSWLMIYFGALQPIGTVETISEDVSKQSGYLVYPFTIMIANSDAIRFRGMFDEPGVIGSYSAILLCINRFNLKDWRSYPLILSGILSFSFFFYIILFVYIAFQLVFIKKKPSYFVLFLVLIAGSFSLTKNNDIIYELLWRRFEWDAEAVQFVGDNRSGAESAIELFYQNIKGTKQYWFGVDNKDQLLSILNESSSYKNAILLYGMLFFLLYCFFFVFYGFKNITNRNAFWVYSLVFIGMVYQRPSIYEPLLLFLFTYFARSFKESEKGVISHNVGFMPMNAMKV